jgi:prepilin-type N-terminal cleavage/methylation domain-containing protein
LSYVAENLKKGFTLAEVLIVLGIIGIIAQQTIPTLVSNVQTQITVVSLKQAYSLLTQVFTISTLENGTPDAWFTASNSDDDNQVLIDKFAPYLKVVKNCSGAAATGCFPSSKMYRMLEGTNYGILDNDGYAIDLTNGMILSAGGYSGVGSSNCTFALGASTQLQNWCASFIVDINGFKLPNQYGKDLFGFYLTTNGIIPQGTQADTWNPFFGNCLDGAGSIVMGGGCTAWIIQNENMDYLKCSDLAWGGKTKCN